MRRKPALRVVADNSSSSVNSTPIERDKRKRSNFLFPGIPRIGQLLTTDCRTPNKRANLVWPPNRETISETVTIPDLYQQSWSTVNHNWWPEPRFDGVGGGEYLSAMPNSALSRKITDDELDAIATGRRLEDIRQTLGYETHVAFAKALGISNTRYGNYARGEKFPKKQLVRKIAQLGGSLDYLFMGYGSPTVKRK